MNISVQNITVILFQIRITMSGHLKKINARRKVRKQMAEDRLNKVISDIAYILNNLRLLREIQNTGDCNICKNRDCGYMPKPGQSVRYNCPFYKAESEE